MVPDGFVCRMEAHLETDGVGNAGVVDGLGLRQRLVEEQRLRFLGEDGKPGLRRPLDLAPMLVRRHRKPDDIDLAGTDHLVRRRIQQHPSLVVPGLVALDLLRTQVLGKGIGQRHEGPDLFRLQLHQLLQVVQPPLPNAHKSDTQLIWQLCNYLPNLKSALQLYIAAGRNVLLWITVVKVGLSANRARIPVALPLWIPAYAGMTESCNGLREAHDFSPSNCDELNTRH